MRFCGMVAFDEQGAVLLQGVGSDHLAKIGKVLFDPCLRTVQHECGVGVGQKSCGPECFGENRTVHLEWGDLSP